MSSQALVETPTEAVELKSVSQQIFEEFIEKLSGLDGYEDIAERLKIELIDNKSMSETALRRALFEEEGT